MDTLDLAPEFQDEVMGTLKKGPWTSAEDAILIAYVTKHGEGNWNSVQKHSGLFRCGKSCRLRWANHLRPNLKKGAFTTEEERMIIELHAKLGNKWARMAAQLPGRTDNEIKNYWNTRIKRLMRAGLPVYPSDMPSPSSRVQIQGGPGGAGPGPGPGPGGNNSAHYNIFDVASHAAGSDGCMSMSSGAAADSDCVPADLVPSPTGSGNVNGLPPHPSALPQDYHGSVQTHSQLNLAAALHAGTTCHSHVMRSSCSSTGITGPPAPGDMHHPSLSSVVTQAVNSPALRAAMQADSPMRRIKRARDAAAMAAVAASVVPNGAAGGPGSAGAASTILSFPQLSDESSKTVPPYLKARRTCGRNSMRMASFAGFTYDPDPHDSTVAGSHLQDAMASMAGASAQRFHLSSGGGSSHGHHHFSTSRPTSGLLKMELPSSQSAESADSAGTPHASSALTSPFTATSFSLSNHLLSSEADSFGSNSNSFASNNNNNSSILEALLQEAQSMDGLGLSDQARLDLADQLLVLSSSSNNPGVEVGANAMMMSPHKSRWQEDSDPTTPLGGRAFSVFSEETSPNCGAGNWEESSTLQSPLVGIKTEDNGEAAPCAVYVTDEEMSTLLDFAREAAPVTEWYTPTSEGPYSMGNNLVAQAQACAASLNDAFGAAFSQDVGNAGLEHMAPATVGNHVWELGSCPWNNLSGACQLGDLIQDCRPAHHSMLAADQMHNDPCAIYNQANLDYCRQ